MFKKVMYPIDVQEGVLCQAAMLNVLKQIRDWQAELVLIYVLPGFGMPIVGSYFPKDAEDAAKAEAAKRVRAFITDQVPAGVRVKSIIAEGTAYEEILDYAEKEKVDLIVVPSHDRQGVERWLIGSTAQKVVEHAGCSVMVLRNCET